MSDERIITNKRGAIKERRTVNMNPIIATSDNSEEREGRTSERRERVIDKSEEKSE